MVSSNKIRQDLFKLETQLRKKRAGRVSCTTIARKKCIREMRLQTLRMPGTGISLSQIQSIEWSSTNKIHKGWILNTSCMKNEVGILRNQTQQKTTSQPKSHSEVRILSQVVKIKLDNNKKESLRLKVETQMSYNRMSLIRIKIEAIRRIINQSQGYLSQTCKMSHASIKGIWREISNPRALIAKMVQSLTCATTKAAWKIKKKFR